MLGLAAVFAILACLATFAPSAQAYIYWSNYGNGFTGGGTTLGRANIDGSAATASFITGASNPAGLAVDAGHLYWSEGGTAIGRANVDGSGINEAFIPAGATAGNVVAIALDSAYIYWTDGSRWIGRANLDGSGANGQFIDMGSGTSTNGIAVSGGELYVGEAGQIARVAATGGTPSTFVQLANGSDFATSLSVVAGYLYWTDLNLGVGASIGRVPLSGNGPNASLIPGLTFPEGIASDGTYIYWTDDGTQTIGRAKLDGSQVNMTFISDPAGPAGLAVDARVDPTSTSISCTPATVAAGGVSACTAAVSDSASTELPSGTVVFSAGSGTFFPGGNSCTLTAQPSGASCTVGAEALTTGIQTIAASYQGDTTHAPSASSGRFCAGGTSVCGASSGSGSGSGTSVTGPGGEPAVCTVPRLKGKTLTQARKLLTAAHCRLGKVTAPRRKRGQRLPPLVVRSQSSPPGRSLPTGAKVNVRLVAKPKLPKRKRG